MRWSYLKSLLVLFVVIAGLIRCSPNTVEFDSLDNEEADDISVQDIAEKHENTPDQIEGKYICTPLVSLEWGENSDQIGYLIEESTNKITGFHSPVFDENGKLYIPNPENNQIITLDNFEYERSIPISESYVFKMGNQKFYWSQIGVANERIILKFSEFHDERIVDRIAILDLSGQVEKIINLEPYYPLHSIYTQAIKTDGYGGFYVNLDPMGIIHYDADFKSNLTYLGHDWNYGDSLIGWDKNLYYYNFQDGHLTKWTSNGRRIAFKKDRPSIVLENIKKMGDMRSLIGVDEKGNIYILMNQNQEDYLLQIDANGDLHRLGLEISPGFVNYFLDKAGNLYAFVYGYKDSEINPRIMKCEP